MKFRDDETTSERQLMEALAAGGRSVSLADLTAWRKDGLLPPLASTGIHSGRAYYWREPDILEQAQTAYDELRRHGRTDAAMITLWLSGFEVPLPRLRRAWLHDHKQRKVPGIRRISQDARRPAADLSGLLHHAAMGVAAVLQPEEISQAGLAMLEHAAARMGLERSATADLHRAWQLAQVTLSVLSASNLMREASDEVLRGAQRTLCVGLDFVWQSCGTENRSAVVAALGRPLFLYILSLLVSGQETLVDAAVAKIAPRRRPTAAPQQPLYARA
ncbi:MAG TPA: hypothetical protein VHC40_03945 [Rhizomicrobium sp.]|nr:hypothetical protein [Rhizomicrobium sp.]